MNTRRRLIATIAFLTLAPPAMAQALESLEGRWTGTWSNSLGESGDDSLELSEDPEGGLSGVWSDEVTVAGQRTGPNSAVLRGRTATRAYEVSVFLRGGRMTLHYSARRLNDRGAYHGQSDLTPVR